MLKRLLNKIKHHRFCKLNHYYCPDCIYHDFVFEGAIFRGNRCRWWAERKKYEERQWLKKYTEYIIDGIIDGMTNAKQTRTDIAFLKQRLYELSAIEKERLTNLFDDFERKEE